MKSHLLSLPVAALMCGAASAQTPTTSGGMYGSTWSQSAGSIFYSDPEMKLMRSPEEVSNRWATLSQEDKDAVMEECVRCRADSGTTAATGTGTAETGTDMATGTMAETGTDTTTGTDGAAAGDATATMGVSTENMKTICDMVEAY